MNLSFLHTGVLGAIEAGLVALLVAVLVYAFWHWLGRRNGLSVAQVLGWSSLLAVAIGAGLDAWYLFYLGFRSLESPVYARLAIAGIHDVDSLGIRVVGELVGAGVGIALGWWLFSSRSEENPDQTRA